MYIFFFDWHSILYSNAEFPTSNATPWLSILCGSTILAFMIYFGKNRTQNAFPIGCYPTFAYMAPKIAETLKIYVCYEDNKEAFHSSILDKQYGSERIRGLFETILEEKNEMALQLKLHAIWKWITKLDDKYQSASQVEFRKVKMSTIPENYATNPIEDKLIYSYSVK